MNLTLAKQAEKDVKNGNAETASGYCLRGVRQFTEHTPIGTKYDRLFRGDGTKRDATAARSAHRFLASGLGFLRKDVLSHGGLQPGDMLFKTQVAPNRWGDFSGHVGTLCEDVTRLAENSSTGIGRVHGALGFRTLAQFGDYDIVVRLPDPATKATAPVSPKAESSKAEPALILVTKDDGGVLTYHRLKTISHADGHFFADKGEVLSVLFGGGGRVPVAEYLEKLGTPEFAPRGNHLDDPTEPREYLFVETK